MMRENTPSRQPLRENQDYDAMFNSLLTGDREGVLQAASLVKSARRELKRYDWVIWYLRWARLALVWHRMLEGKVDARKTAEFAHRMAARLGVPSGNMVKWMQTSPSYDGLMDWIIQLSHFRSLPIQQIIDYRPINEMPTALLKLFAELEKKWKEGSKNLLPAAPGDRKLLSVGKGLAWWMLDRAYCPKEAGAMGHCGNEGRRSTTDRLLSLRQEVKQGMETFYKPYLTFVLYSDGKLGERKARFNESPKNAAAKGFIPSDFQREIVALLKQPFIKGFGSEGYAPQNDFKITDLSPALQDELLDARPEFADLRSTITPETMGRLADLPLEYADVRDTDQGEEPLWSARVTLGWLTKRIGMKAAITEVEAAMRSNGTTSTDSPMPGVDLETRERFPMAFRVTLDRAQWEKVVKHREWRAMVSLVEAEVPTDYYEKRRSFTEEGKNIINAAMLDSAKRIAPTLSPVFPREIPDVNGSFSVEVDSVELAEKLAMQDYVDNVGQEDLTVEWLYGFGDNNEVADLQGPFDVQLLNTAREEIIRWNDDNLDPEWNVKPVGTGPNIDKLPSGWETMTFWTHGPGYHVPNWKRRLKS